VYCLIGYDAATPTYLLFPFRSSQVPSIRSDVTPNRDGRSRSVQVQHQFSLVEHAALGPRRKAICTPHPLFQRSFNSILNHAATCVCWWSTGVNTQRHWPATTENIHYPQPTCTLSQIMF